VRDGEREGLDAVGDLEGGLERGALEGSFVEGEADGEALGTIEIGAVEGKEDSGL